MRYTRWDCTAREEAASGRETASCTRWILYQAPSVSFNSAERMLVSSMVRDEPQRKYSNTRKHSSRMRTDRGGGGGRLYPTLLDTLAPPRKEPGTRDTLPPEGTWCQGYIIPWKGHRTSDQEGPGTRDITPPR